MNAKVIFVCLTAVVATNGYSTGSPTDACFDMTPQHGVDPQKSPAPYRLLVSKSQLRSGDTVDVTITGLSPKDKIKGFMIQAQVGYAPAGKWIVDRNNPYGQPLNCGNGIANAITHKKINGDGEKYLMFTWEAPRLDAATVQFRATIALNGGVFWVGILSPPVTVI